MVNIKDLATEATAVFRSAGCKKVKVGQNIITEKGYMRVRKIVTSDWHSNMTEYCFTLEFFWKEIYTHKRMLFTVYVHE